MQFFYQFPQRVERLALISSGGLGREVSPLLRSAALPGVSALLTATITPAAVGGLAGAGALLRERGRTPASQLQAIARALRPLENGGAREAFLHTLRAVIDIHGQRVGATDRLGLLSDVPTLIVWGERDRTIPIEHGRLAHESIAGSELAHCRASRTSRTWKTRTRSRACSASSSPAASRERWTTRNGSRSSSGTLRAHAATLSGSGQRQRQRRRAATPAGGTAGRAAAARLSGARAR